jgi:hypothetical protein
MNIRNLVTPAVCFAFVVFPTALSGLIGMLVGGAGIYFQREIGISVLGISVSIFSICIISLWVKSFISVPGKHISQITQFVLLFGSIIMLTFSIVQGLEGNVLASIIGLCYVLAIAGMSLNYYYHRAQV